MKSQDQRIPWETSFALGLAILCKFSWLFLVPLLPLVIFVHDFRTRGYAGKYAALRSGKLCVSFVLSLAMINLIYGSKELANVWAIFNSSASA